MVKKNLATFDREMKEPNFKKAFYESYKEFLISELIITMMERDKKSKCLQSLIHNEEQNGIQRFHF